jgi:hypothetical protein
VEHSEDGEAGPDRVPGFNADVAGNLARRVRRDNVWKEKNHLINRLKVNSSAWTAVAELQ